MLVTHGFLRSLANLDLAPSVVGALRRAGEGNGGGPAPGPATERPLATRSGRP